MNIMPIHESHEHKDILVFFMFRLSRPTRFNILILFLYYSYIHYLKAEKIPLGATQTTHIFSDARTHSHTPHRRMPVAHANTHFLYGPFLSFRPKIEKRRKQKPEMAERTK